MTWYSIFCVRDSVGSIKGVVDSLLNQSIPPAEINIVDDGSTDGTRQILESYGNQIKLQYTDNSTRDYSRIPYLWNRCLVKKYFFHMIMAGDVTLEKNYAEILLNEFEIDSKLVVASGGFGGKTTAPIGAGRMVRQSFSHRYYPKYVEKVGYESAILFIALMNGYKINLFPEAKMYHHEKLGGGHKFSEWGWSMASLGYHPLYALGRCVHSFLFDKSVGKKGAINMFYKYMTFHDTKDGYLSYFPQDLRKSVSDYQIKYMKQKIRGVFI